LRRVSGFEAVCAFEPLARLVQRDGTLDGAVPLRVAQACVPLLEGNAFGHQIVFSKRLTARVRLGRRTLATSPELDAVDRGHRAAVPLLAARGLLRARGAWHAQLAKSWWWSERGVLRIWTGLLVRPRPGTLLRVSGAGSRAILGLGVRTAWIAGEDLVPLVIDFDRVEDGTRLEGEVATVAAVAPGLGIDVVGLDEAPELGHAHAAFYDAKYFATKKGEVTRKYRKLVNRAAKARDEEGEEGAIGERGCVAHLAGPAPEVVTIDRVLGAAAMAPEALPRGVPPVGVVRFANAVPFTAHFDGNTLAVEPDRAVLARGARLVERELAKACGEEILTGHEGASLYLTKYFTPHPHGEPHFFVKPWAFLRTPPGWSSVLEGVRGDGFDIMRGVVWTDRFHATPAVFSVRPAARVRVREGAPLLDAVPVPRKLLAESFSLTRLET